MTWPVNSAAWSDIRHLGNPNTEKNSLYNMCTVVHTVIVGDVCLGVTCKVVFDNQHVLHDQLFFNAYCDLHRHVSSVYQVERFCTNNWFHGQYLGLSLKDTALFAVADVHHHSLGNAWPPKPFSKQA